MAFTLEIVTPKDKALSEEVDYVSLPGAEGDMGIFPQHVPFVTEVKPGEVTFQKKSSTSRYAVGAGFVQVMPDKISILTDMAIDEAAIDEERAEEARKRAEERLNEKLSDEEIATTKAALANALAQLRVKKRI